MSLFKIYSVAGAINPNLLTTTIVALPSNASKWQMGFISAFKGLMMNRKGFERKQLQFIRENRITFLCLM